jgi:hypothetical protein
MAAPLTWDERFAQEFRAGTPYEEIRSTTLPPPPAARWHVTYSPPIRALRTTDKPPENYESPHGVLVAGGLARGGGDWQDQGRRVLRVVEDLLFGWD